MDLDRQGQGQIVTCSGAYKDGSLRVIRNGIGINEQAQTELAGIKGMWSLRRTFDTEQDTYLVQSFVNESRVLGFSKVNDATFVQTNTIIDATMSRDDENHHDNDDDHDNDEFELAEHEIPGLKNTKTLLCRNMVGDLWLQVTEDELRLIDCSTMELVESVSRGNYQRMTLAAANPTQVVVAHAGGVLRYFQVRSGVRQGRLECITETKLPHEIACIDVTPPLHEKVHTKSPTITGTSSHWDTRVLSTRHCAVGLWSELSVLILSLPSLAVEHKQLLGGEVLPRSLLCSVLDGQEYLLVGMGDGMLFTFLKEYHDQDQYHEKENPPCTLTPHKRMSLGTQPIFLSPFRCKDAVHVFAASDRPTVIYAHNGKLLFSNV
jgi:DNA damage-binding protein 1